MNKSFIAILIIAAFAVSEARIVSHGVQRINGAKQSVEFSFCSICNSFINQGINQLLNVILQGGVLGGCADLCGKAFPDPSQKTIAGICNLLCDAVGVYSFIHLVQKYSQDLDSIYFCELLHACPIHDGGKAQLDKMTTTPPSGPQGTTFEIDVLFTVFNQTGTGELEIAIIPPQSQPFGDGEIDTGFAPGQYGIKFNLQANPSEDEAFEAGLYQVQFAMCDGECGAPLPHTATLFTGSSNFTITQ